jgi:MFS family permease
MCVIRYQFDLSSAQTGLVFTAFGTAYTLATPVFGILSDKVCFILNIRKHVSTVFLFLLLSAEYLIPYLLNTVTVTVDSVDSVRLFRYGTTGVFPR